MLKSGTESFTSEWAHVHGGVPQGTLSGPELFGIMVSDLIPPHPTVKYVDDTTIVEVYDKESKLQESADYLQEWSESNHLYLNSKKTKDTRSCIVRRLLIWYCSSVSVQAKKDYPFSDSCFL